MPLTLCTPALVAAEGMNGGHLPWSGEESTVNDLLYAVCQLMFRPDTFTTLPKSNSNDCSLALSLDQRVVATPSIAYLGRKAAACCDEAVARRTGWICGVHALSSWLTESVALGS